MMRDKDQAAQRERMEREERYRHFELGRDVRDVLEKGRIDHSGTLRVIKWLADTVEWYRMRLERSEWLEARLETALERALSACAGDKLGECMSLLYAMKADQEALKGELADFLELRRKAVESGQAE